MKEAKEIFGEDVFNFEKIFKEAGEFSDKDNKTPTANDVLNMLAKIKELEESE